LASGNTLCVFTPYQNEPPTTNYATLDIRNQHPVLDFDDTTGEVAIFTVVMPRHYAGGGVTVYVHHAASSATTGTIGWLVAFERIGAVLDLDADSFAADQTVTATTVNGTAGIPNITSVGFTDGAQMDSVAAGEAFRLRITRDVASDSAVGDAELIAVEIKET